MSEYEIYIRAFKSMAACGELCRGTECRGYHLSEVDTWHKCGATDCAGAGAPHPEAAIEEPAETDGEAEADLARFAEMADEEANRYALDDVRF
jgi:hypothetical protein